MWMYLLEVIADSTERYMIFSNAETEFKDVGMFTYSEWQLLVSKTLSELII